MAPLAHPIPRPRDASDREGYGDLERYQRGGATDINCNLFQCSCILFVVGYYVWNLPRCLRGHDVPRFVAEETILQPFQIGESTLYMPSTEPAHWVKDFVCDQYEVER